MAGWAVGITCDFDVFSRVLRSMVSPVVVMLMEAVVESGRSGPPNGCPVGSELARISLVAVHAGMQYLICIVADVLHG